MPHHLRKRSKRNLAARHTGAWRPTTGRCRGMDGELLPVCAAGRKTGTGKQVPARPRDPDFGPALALLTDELA